ASQLGRRACRAIEALELPTIARVQGHAVGGGFALALACDFRIAAESAVFHVPEVDLGVPLTWGATPRLILEVGAARAREIILMCDPISAAQAERWGIANRVVPEDQLDAVVEQWAGRLAAKPEAAVHMTKTQFRAFAQRANLGDVSESDGDLLMSASRGAVARESFRAEGTEETG
ncbi:MAG: enoyl-CoA hydratase/isomerase family protein, partial [Myxococcota bacterium]